MPKHPRHMAQGGIIAALYVILTYLQNALIPGSTTMAVQLRLSEMLCILAFFTPAAISGLTVGCLVFNLSYAGALPLDILAGTCATFLAAWGMWHCRSWRIFSLPLPGLLLPALCNALLVGPVLTVHVGGGLLLNIASVALGEALVLLIPGALLYTAICRRGLAHRLFKS